MRRRPGGFGIGAGRLRCGAALLRLHAGQLLPCPARLLGPAGVLTLNTARLAGLPQIFGVFPLRFRRYAGLLRRHTGLLRLDAGLFRRHAELFRLLAAGFCGIQSHHLGNEGVVEIRLDGLAALVKLGFQLRRRQTAHVIGLVVQGGDDVHVLEEVGDDVHILGKWRSHLIPLPPFH